MKVTEYQVNTKTFLLPLVGLAVLVVLWKARIVLLLVVTALLIAASLGPIVIRVRRYLPLHFAALVVVLGLFLPLGLAVVLVSSHFASETPALLQTILGAVRDTSFLPPSVQTMIQNFFSSPALGNGYAVSVDKVTSMGLGMLALVVMTYAILIDVDWLREAVITLVPRRHQTEVAETIQTFGTISGEYIRGNMLISLVCGVILYVGMLALHIPYAGQLAVLSAILDLLPLVGAVVVAVPAALLGFMISPTVSVLTILLFVVYQEAENHILVPIIYNKALSLRPVPVLVVVLIGATLFGTAGAFIALPIAAAVPALAKLSLVEELLQ